MKILITLLKRSLHEDIKNKFPAGVGSKVDYLDNKVYGKNNTQKWVLQNLTALAISTYMYTSRFYKIEPF